MWILVALLTLVLWLILDNILVAAMLAIFALFLFTTTRSLWLLRKEQTMEKVSQQESANLPHFALSNTEENANELKQAVSQTNREQQNQVGNQADQQTDNQANRGVNAQKNIQQSDLMNRREESAEIDDSYLRLVEDESVPGVEKISK